MAKKQDGPEQRAIEALSKALVDDEPRVMHGTARMPGFFNGAGQAVKLAARYCEENGWVEGTGEWIGKGASKKQKYRITARGLQAILERSENAALLRNLSEAFAEQLNLFSAMQEQLSQIARQFEPLSAAVASLSAKMQPPDIEAMVNRLAQPATPTAISAPRRAWLDEAVSLIRHQHGRDRLQPLSLPGLFAKLSASQPGLSLGEFHDGLRNLRDSGRIRFLPFTRALATLEDGRNALFLDGEVMYYVDLP